MKKFILTGLFAIAAFTLGFAGNYKVSVSLPEDFDGAMAYIINYDNGNKIDSVLVEDGVAEFSGLVEEPILARLIIDGNRADTFILEDGEISINPQERSVKGGKLNEENNALQDKFENLAKKFKDASNEAEKDEIYNQYLELQKSALKENLTTPIGYMLFMNTAYDMAPSELESFVEANPYFSKFERVKNLLEANRRKMATAEGAMFTDFEIEYEGVKHKLSDVVGKGDYVLVDFWASWCGPCIRQAAVLKDIYKEYKDDGLKILGVAVWDEPENTKKAIVQHELPWESWLNGQNIPTDAYGISGIPCIILFGPDGTILSRDKQSDELKADVAKAMKEANAQKTK